VADPIQIPPLKLPPPPRSVHGAHRLVPQASPPGSGAFLRDIALATISPSGAASQLSGTKSAGATHRASFSAAFMGCLPADM
jgi:hypothetical protein